MDGLESVLRIAYSGQKVIYHQSIWASWSIWTNFGIKNIKHNPTTRRTVSQRQIVGLLSGAGYAEFSLRKTSLIFNLKIDLITIDTHHGFNSHKIQMFF